MERKCLFEIYNVNKDKEDIKEILICAVKNVHEDISDIEIRKEVEKHFLPKVKEKWNKHGRKIEIFKTKEAEWLKGKVMKISPKDISAAGPGPGPGRSLKSFADSSDRSKRRKVAR